MWIARKKSHNQFYSSLIQSSHCFNDDVKCSKKEFFFLLLFLHFPHFSFIPFLLLARQSSLRCRNCASHVKHARPCCAREWVRFIWKHNSDMATWFSDFGLKQLVDVISNQRVKSSGNVSSKLRRRKRLIFDLTLLHCVAAAVGLLKKILLLLTLFISFFIWYIRTILGIFHNGEGKIRSPTTLGCLAQYLSIHASLSWLESLS